MRRRNSGVEVDWAGKARCNPEATNLFVNLERLVNDSTMMMMMTHKDSIGYALSSRSLSCVVNGSSFRSCSSTIPSSFPNLDTSDRYS